MTLLTLITLKTLLTAHFDDTNDVADTAKTAVTDNIAYTFNTGDNIDIADIAVPVDSAGAPDTKKHR